jgi:hypothetical protein
MTERYEFKAPWGMLLTAISAGVVALFIGLVAAGNARGSVMVVFPLLLLLALPFAIRGYAVSEGVLVIKRLGWETVFPLVDLQSVEINPHAMRSSIRLFGNGGLFSFTGLYRSKALGKYRAFVNDMDKTVVLRFPERTIVVSPGDPEGFVEAVKRLSI